MKKRHWLKSFVAAVTASALVWTCAPVGALAADQNTGVIVPDPSEGVTLPVNGGGWYLDEDGTLTIKSDEGMTHWKRISDHTPWNAYNSYVKKAVIEDGVTSVGSLGLENLTSVSISDSVTTIEGGAFGGSELTSIVIPNSVTTIGAGAFSDCDKLVNVTLSDKITSIENSLFLGCTSLTNICIPSGVQSIGMFAFDSCSNLVSVDIPDSVTSIEKYAFYGCKNLNSIIIPNGVTSIEYCTFGGCEKLKSATLSNNLTEIQSYAFSGCNDLTDLTIPNNVTIIKDNAFWGCNNLKNVEIPDSVTTIEKYAFRECSNLTSVTIPDSVTTIGTPSPFIRCPNLTVYCNSGSYAETFCKENNVRYLAIDEYYIPFDVRLSHKDIDASDDDLAATPEGYLVHTYEITAVITNPNEKAVQNATAELNPNPDNEENPRISLADGVAAKQTIGDLQAGESRTLTWKVNLKVAMTEPSQSFIYKVTADSDSTAAIDKFARIFIDQGAMALNPLTDSWSFGNEPVNYNETLTKDDHESLLLDETPTDKQNIINAINESKTTPMALCFGMSVTTLLTQNGLIDPTSLPMDYEKFSRNGGQKPTNIHDIKLTQGEETNTSIASLLTFYQLQQKFIRYDALIQEYKDKYRGNKIYQIQSLVNLLYETKRGGQPVAISVNDEITNMSHMVLGYDLEEIPSNDPMYTIGVDVLSDDNNVYSCKFTHRIKLYDCNSPVTSSAPYGSILYVNVGTGDWALRKNYSNLGTNMPIFPDKDNPIPGTYDEYQYDYHFNSYSKKSYIKFATNKVEDLNVKDYEISTDNYKAELQSGKNVGVIEEIVRFVQGIAISKWKSSDINNSEIWSYSDDDVSPNDSAQSTHIVLPDDSSDYSVESGDAYDYSLRYSDALISAKADKADSVTFSKDGSAELKGNEGHYELSSTLNDAPMDLFTVTASGEKATDVKLVPTEDGYLVDGNDLSDLTISGNDADQTKTLPLNTDEKSVKVTEDSENELVVSIDQDEDGTYETPIATTESVKSISLNKTSLSMRVGDTASLTATCDPTDATVRWTSSNSSVATVENGTVKALKPGTATIMAKAGDKSATCTVTVTSSGMPSTPSQPSKPSNPGTPSTPSIPSKPAAPETEMTTNVTLQNGRTVTISSPDDVIEIPQSSTFEVRFQSAKSIPTFALTAGNGKSIATDTVTAWNPATREGTYTLYGLGAPGTAHDTTGIYVNGVKLFSMKVVPRPLTSDTTVDFAMHVGQTYQFWVKPDDPSASYTFNTANGDMLQTAIVKDAYPDAQGRYLCRLTVTGRGDTVGVYCQIDGNTYKLFTVDCR